MFILLTTIAMTRLKSWKTGQVQIIDMTSYTGLAHIYIPHQSAILFMELRGLTSFVTCGHLWPFVACVAVELYWPTGVCVLMPLLCVSAPLAYTQVNLLPHIDPFSTGLGQSLQKTPRKTQPGLRAHDHRSRPLMTRLQKTAAICGLIHETYTVKAARRPIIQN